MRNFEERDQSRIVVNIFNRLHFAIALIIVLGGPLSSVVAIGPVTVSVDRNQVYHPGDLVELSVSIRSSNYSRYALREPTHQSVRFLETQSFPVEKNQEGEYEKSWMVLYQISRSGNLALEGGFIEAESRSEPVRFALEAIAFESQGFGMEEDSNLPEALSPTEIEKQKGRAILLVIAMVLLGTAFLWALYFRRKDRETLREEEFPARISARNLLAEMDSGRMPMDALERFLYDYPAFCSERLSRALERVVYSKSEQRKELSEQLRKEFSL